jgi:CDGSH-type Zn-finger protein
MPTIINEDREGHIRTIIVIQPGERLKLCRCMKSKELPFCDGTHKTLTDTNAGPVIVQFDPPGGSETPSKPGA